MLMNSDCGLQSHIWGFFCPYKTPKSEYFIKHIKPQIWIFHKTCLSKCTLIWSFCFRYVFTATSCNYCCFGFYQVFTEAKENTGGKLCHACVSLCVSLTSYFGALFYLGVHSCPCVCCVTLFLRSSWPWGTTWTAAREELSMASNYRVWIWWGRCSFTCDILIPSRHIIIRPTVIQSFPHWCTVVLCQLCCWIKTPTQVIPESPYSIKKAVVVTCRRFLCYTV